MPNPQNNYIDSRTPEERADEPETVTTTTSASNLDSVEEIEEPTYYRTIVTSPIWKEWTKHQEEVMEWDVWESIETGWLSEGHWRAFCEWLLNNKE